MTTRARTFWPSVTDQDGAWGTDVRKLLEANPADANTTTVCRHPNAAGTTTITVDPYTTRTTQNDARADFGWAVDRLGGDGMGSTATRKRVVPGGTWRFRSFLVVSAPAVLGSTSYQLTYGAWRVSASFGRTLLFSFAGVAQASSVVVTSLFYDETSPSQPELVLDADETLHVGYLTTVVQVAGLLGATVVADAAFSTGDTFNFTNVEIPAPGVVDRVFATHAGSSVPTGALVLQGRRSLAGTSTPTGALVRRPTKVLAGTSTPTGALVLQGRRSLAGTSTPTGALVRRPTKALAGATTPTGALRLATTKTVSSALSASGALRFAVSRSFAGTTTPAGALARTPRLTLGPSVLAPGPGTLRLTPGKATGGVLTPGPGTLRALIQKNLPATLALSGLVVKRLSRSFAGSTTPVGALARRPVKAFSGLIGPGGGVGPVRKVVISIFDD